METEIFPPSPPSPQLGTVSSRGEACMPALHTQYHTITRYINRDFHESAETQSIAKDGGAVGVRDQKRTDVTTGEIQAPMSISSA